MLELFTMIPVGNIRTATVQTDLLHNLSLQHLQFSTLNPNTAGRVNGGVTHDLPVPCPALIKSLPRGFEGSLALIIPAHVGACLQAPASAGRHLKI